MYFFNIIIVYDSIASKYTKLEESFCGFIERCLVRFEYQKSPLHNIVYGRIVFKTIYRSNFN